MTENLQTEQLKQLSNKPVITLAGGNVQCRRMGRPSRDITSLIGSVHGSLTILGRAKTGLSGILAGRLLPSKHLWVLCSCECGRYTASTPKAIRLDHIMQDGPDRTLSCGCVGGRRYKENGEGLAARMSPSKVTSIFAAIVSSPRKIRWDAQHIRAIARKFNIAVAMVGHCYRYWRDRLQAGVAAVSDVESSWLSKHRLHVPQIYILDEADILEPGLRFAFGLCPA